VKLEGKSEIKNMMLSLAVCLLCVVGKIEGKDFNQQDEKPNVLFGAIDDLNDWTGMLKGNPQARTPHMDKLASQGVVFTNAHCAAPAYGPSRSAIMTGIRPSTSGNYVNRSSLTRNPILNNSVLLPEFFQQNGYYVCDYGKLFHGAHFNNEVQGRGFGVDPAQRKGEKRGQGRNPFDQLTEEQKSQVDAKVKEMREAGTDRREIRKQMVLMLEGFGVDLSQRQGKRRGKGQNPFDQLTEEQKSQIDGKVKELRQAGATRQEIREQVNDMLEGFGLEVPKKKRGGKRGFRGKGKRRYTTPGQVKRDNLK